MKIKKGKKRIKSSQALSLQKYNTLNINVCCQGLCQFADYYTLYSPFVFSLANSLQLISAQPKVI